MYRRPGVCALLFLLVVSGCGSSEKAEAPQGKKETVAEKAGEAAATVAGGVKDAARAVAEKAGDVEQQAGPAVTESVEKAQAAAAVAAEKAQDMADQTVAAGKETVTKTGEAASEVMSAVAEKAETAALATTQAAGEAVERVQQSIAPGTVVLDADYGKVTFPHDLHDAAYACSVCHGEGVPGVLALGKDKAHALCRDCHKQVGAGPTGCRDCHKQ
ncbi:MAG: cytochrome c3 family protein [Desulfuromonadales bacterium]|nr:cytochrome c3 family protein [Desulfuromonadales bacterium]